METIHRAGAAKIIYFHKRKPGFNLFSPITSRRAQPNTNSLFTQIVHNESIYLRSYGTSIIKATMSWKRSLRSSKASPLIPRPTCVTVLFLKGQCPSTEGESMTVCCNYSLTKYQISSWKSNCFYCKIQEIIKLVFFRIADSRKDYRPQRTNSASCTLKQVGT